MPEFSPALQLASLFLAGLLGGGHCVGMCGGIVGALSLQTQNPSWTIHLAYNLGRIGSYVLAGAMAGAVGQVFGLVLSIQHDLYLIAQLMLVGMGLYLLGLTRVLAPMEWAGRSIWRRVQPLMRHWLPVRGVGQALPLGLLWGWLPCGLVYSALVSALSSGSSERGALVMLAFGLGTLPNLLLAGLLVGRFRRLAQMRVVRICSGLLICAFGLAGLYRALL